MSRMLLAALFTLAAAGLDAQQRVSHGDVFTSGSAVFRAAKRGAPPVRIGDLPGVPQLLATDREAVYVVVRPRDGEAAKLYALPKDGGEPLLLATRLGNARELRVDGGYVYWSNETGVERVTTDGWEREAVR